MTPGPTDTDEHVAPLLALGVPTEDVPPLAEYLTLVAAWNLKTNLTAARTPEERVRVLVADAWRAASRIRTGALIDVGSGNGSPALVLALLRRDLSVTLLEPRARRWAFLREASRRLDRPDIRIERTRCEDYRTPPVPTITVRAVGIPLAGMLHLLDAAGEILVFGGRPRLSSSLEIVTSHPLERGDLHVVRRIVSRET